MTAVDFTSPFWSWFVIACTLGGIFMMFWLIIWLGGNTDAKVDDEGNAEVTGHVWDDTLEEYNNPLPGWWLNMFYITLIFGLVYLALYPGLGSYAGAFNWSSACNTVTVSEDGKSVKLDCEVDSSQYRAEVDAAEAEYGPLFAEYQDTPIPELIGKPEALAMGERLYLNYCTVCHGSDARGTRGYPNLRDDDWLYGGEPEKIEHSILKGRVAAGMMPWKEHLGGDEGVEQVAHYVLTLADRESEIDPKLAAQGKEKFAVCMACHGMEGKGNQMLGAPNLTDDIWLYGGDLESIKKSIAYGRAGVMPAHENFLGKAKVRLVSAYIYSLSNSPTTAANEATATPAAEPAAEATEAPSAE